MTLLARAYQQADRTDEGLRVLQEAQVSIDARGERWWEAEIQRLRGELLLSQSGANAGDAEACFERALQISRRQEAKSLELRATMSLARLWRRQGKGDEVRRLLGECYTWFTEGFDTADLKEAKVLLDELKCPHLGKCENMIATNRTSACGYKRKSGPCCRHVRSTPNSGHSSADVRFLPDYVCFTPISGRSRWGRGMTAYDPTQT